MLSELTYEATGKLTGVRVLDDKGTMEMSIQEWGTIYGIKCSITATVVSTPGPGGILYAAGPGLLRTDEGDAATLNLSQIAIPKGPGLTARCMGTVFARTQSPKLAKMNSVIGIYEADVVADGSYTAKGWDWE